MNIISGIFIFVQHVGYYLWHSVAAAAYTSKRIMIATTTTPPRSVSGRAFFRGVPVCFWMDPAETARYGAHSRGKWVFNSKCCRCLLDTSFPPYSHYTKICFTVWMCRLDTFGPNASCSKQNPGHYFRYLHAVVKNIEYKLKKNPSSVAKKWQEGHL